MNERVVAVLEEHGLVGLRDKLEQAMVDMLEAEIARRFGPLVERFEELTFQLRLTASDGSAAPSGIRDTTLRRASHGSTTDRVMSVIVAGSPVPLTSRAIVRALRDGRTAKQAASLDNDHLRAIRRLVKKGILVKTDDNLFRLATDASKTEGPVTGPVPRREGLSISCDPTNDGRPDIGSA